MADYKRKHKCDGHDIEQELDDNPILGDICDTVLGIPSLIPHSVDLHLYVHSDEPLEYIIDLVMADTGIALCSLSVVFRFDNTVHVFDADVLYSCGDDVPCYEDAFLASCDNTQDEHSVDAFLNDLSGVMESYMQDILCDTLLYVREDICSAGITQCPSYVPVQTVLGLGQLAEHTLDVPVVPDRTDKKMATRVKHILAKQQKTLADELK